MGYSDYAPDALIKLGKLCDKKLSGCQFSGVKGDSAHVYGYHRGRNVLPRGDYSVQLPLDRVGPAGACAGLDLSFTAKQMKVMTARLRKSALDPNDHRLETVREFYGTLNGRQVYGLTKSGLRSKWHSSTADSSHLSHIHISFFRKFATNYNAVKPLFDVLFGTPAKKSSAPTKSSSSTSGGITVDEFVKGVSTPIPYNNTSGKRIEKKGWKPVSIKTELDLIWEGQMRQADRLAALEANVAELLKLVKELS